MIIDSKSINGFFSITKDILEIILYAIMSQVGILAWIATYPFVLPIVMSLLALSFGAFSAINVYKLIRGPDRSFRAWFDTLVSILTAALAGVSLFGASIAGLLGVSFVLGPFFFLAALMVGIFHQAVSLGFNVVAIFSADLESESPENYAIVQSLIQNIFVLTLLGAIMGTALFALVAPIAPLVTAIFSLTAAALTVVHLTWMLTPPSWKADIKNHLGLLPPSEQKDLKSTPLSKLCCLHGDDEDLGPEPRRYYGSWLGFYSDPTMSYSSRMSDDPTWSRPS